MAQNYNDTIHKMQTPFEMRAGLPKKEPKMLEDWEQNHVYEQMIKNNEGKPQYILHDGPPYANGNIHMGTALNKIIKDIIIRYKNMSGFQAPYVPGYDTHGLPIELKALSSLGDKKAGVSKLELRQICKEFATEHIGVMNEQFKRLGLQGDFECRFIFYQHYRTEQQSAPDYAHRGGLKRCKAHFLDRAAKYAHDTPKRCTGYNKQRMFFHLFTPSLNLIYGLIL